MDIKHALILDGSDLLSKALENLTEYGTAVLVTKSGQYFGLIDDKNLREGITDPSRVKCESVCVKSPVLSADSSLEEKLNSFLAGHFKALPILDSKGKPVGLYTRADLLGELLQLKVIPKDYVRILMNSPVYTVQFNDSVSVAKKLMKDKGANRLVVLRNGKPVGLISTHDFTTFLVKPQSRKGLSVISEVTNMNEMLISNFMRDEVPHVNDDSLLEEAMKKMADGNFSSVLVVSAGIAKGILSATDVFKRVLKLSSNEPTVTISGLGEDEQKQYDYVKSAILGVVMKFQKSFSISDITLHFKKGKSVYGAKMHVNVGKTPLAISAEDYSFNSTVDMLAKELHNILTKEKSKASDKLPRVKSGEDEI